MDLEIPDFATYNRSFGTVIVRIKMQKSSENRGSRGRVHRPAPVSHLQSGCEHCNRNRIISKHNSDCDSVVEKCRNYSSSTARSRYVNVCAAVCLLLLVGGLAPQSSAAPHLSRTMDRQRRAIDDKIKRLWDNPCDYTDSNSSPAVSPNTKELADNLALQAGHAFTQAQKYKDDFAIMHNFQKFEDLVSNWGTSNFLRKFSWFQEDVLPKEKVLFTPISDDHLNNVVGKMDDKILMPAMYRALKMIVAGLYAFTRDGFADNIAAYENLKGQFNTTMHDVRAVLCLFTDIMKARGLEIPALADSELPDFTDDTGFALYSDTLNYLEYLSQVFHKFKETA